MISGMAIPKVMRQVGLVSTEKASFMVQLTFCVTTQKILYRKELEMAKTSQSSTTSSSQMAEMLTHKPRLKHLVKS